MKKIYKLFIALLVLLPVLSTHQNRNEDIKVVFASSINPSQYKELENSYASIYDEARKGVVLVNNYTNVGGLLDLQSIGSGFFYDEDDIYYYLMTNYHVVEGNSALAITTFTKQMIFNIREIGHDAEQDIAILQVNKASVYGEIKLLDCSTSTSNLNVGDMVFAIGTPASNAFTFTLTMGIISGLNRIVSDYDDDIFAQTHAIQTDCAVNPGNSGGPLLNMDGKVVGVNTIKLVGEDIEVEGLNFALPIDDMSIYASKIREKYWNIRINYKERISLSNNHYYRSLADISLRDRKRYGIDRLYKGVVLMANDQDLSIPIHSVITTIDDIELTSVVQLRKFLLTKSKNEIVTIKYYENNNGVLGTQLLTKQVMLRQITLSS